MSQERKRSEQQKATEDPTAKFDGQATPRIGREIRCPKCQALVDIAAGTALTNLICLTCGNQFSHDGQIEKNFTELPQHRFQMIQQLGEGGFGAVYLAYDKVLERQVAVKTPFTDGLTDTDVKNLVQEARTLARLKHPGIVSLYDVHFCEGKTVSLIMEYVDGSSLQTRMQKRDLSREEIIELAIQISEAAHYAHTQGFIHRDLKPSNILFHQDGRASLADFGLALHESVQRKRAGERSGTLRYMSPEQVRGDAHLLDGRTDIWSIGVILYELLTGRRPFDGESHNEIREEILRRSPKPLRQIDSSIPAELERTCLKCLSKSIPDRFNTASDLAEQLRESLTTASPVAVGAPVGKSPLPLRLFAAKGNIGRLGCGLSITILSLLVVASGLIVHEVKKRRAEALAKTPLTGQNLAAPVPKFPPDEQPLVDKAESYTKAGRLDDAVKVRQELVELRSTKLGPDEPGIQVAKNELALAYLRAGQLNPAAKLYHESLSGDIQEQEAESLNALAWALSTANNDELRDREWAVKLATKACELTEYKDPEMLTTLAAAYAETGNFEAATKWANQAFTLTPAVDNVAFRESILRWLENYKAKKPIRGEPLPQQ